jgi:Rrf2 family transcriptional regulator, iron-sulfur cluster assembly transcription factor
MNLLRQNTDYALRMLVALGKRHGDLVNARSLAEESQVPYQFAAKILQKLHDEKVVESVMGPRGGFKLAGHPSGVHLYDVIRIVQGPVVLNTCLLGEAACDRKDTCPITGKLAALQETMDAYLRGITLDDLLAGNVNLTEAK